MATTERYCCSFITWTIIDNGNQLVLRVAPPPGMPEAVEAIGWLFAGSAVGDRVQRRPRYRLVAESGRRELRMLGQQPPQTLQVPDANHPCPTLRDRMIGGDGTYPSMANPFAESEVPSHARPSG